MQQLQAIAFDPKIRLGQGGSGSVFVGTWKDQEVAVKRVQSIDIDEKEERALRQLTHSNVVKLLDVESDNAFKYFALELCKASLDQVFLENDDPKRYSGPPLPHSFTVLSQLANGLEYIHSKNLIHRDVKPENVLIHVDSEEKVTMKWADFGLSKPVNERGTYTMSGIRGTMSWMAPELLTQNNVPGRQPRPLRGTVKSDVFAEGCVFGYFLSDGLHPFGNLDWEIPSNIARNTLINVEVIQSSYARELILKMLDNELPSRITSKQVCEKLESDIKELKQMEPKLFECLKAPQVNLEEVRKLLHQGVDVNCENADKCTPLLYLAKNSRGKINLKETIELLLSFPVNVNKEEKRGYNALHFLCWFYQQRDLIDVLRLLIVKGIEVNLIEPNENCNALHLLCENYRIDNLIDIVQLLIDKKMAINQKNKDGWNALHIVCQHYKNENLLDIVRLLIDKGIDFKSSEENEMKCNALHLLCENYREKNLTDIIQLLIGCKIDVNSRNKDGWNGLHLACKHYDKDDLIRIVQLFIKYGIDVNSTENKKGYNALHLVCENYQSNKLIKIIKHLVKKGIPVKSRNMDGWNALHLVCQNYKNENLINIVQFLIRNGIKAYSKTNKGWNALLILCKNYFNANLTEIVQLLIANGIDLNWKNDKRWNALHLLCKYYSNVNLIEIIQLLIEHNIDLNCTTNEGNALFLLCKYYPNKNLIKLLELFISKGITVKWNGIEPRILIRQNRNQEYSDDYVQLFDSIILPATEVGGATGGNQNENVLIADNATVSEKQSNGHSH